MKTATYMAIYRKNEAMAVALFRDEQDAKEWHDNPAMYSNCRRRVIISPTPDPELDFLRRLLRDIVGGDPNSVEDDRKMVQAIADARKLLGLG